MIQGLKYFDVDFFVPPAALRVFQKALCSIVSYLAIVDFTNPLTPHPPPSWHLPHPLAHGQTTPPRPLASGQTVCKGLGYTYLLSRIIFAL